MIFDRLADTIIKHAKVIIAIWVVLLIVSVPLALKSGDVMNYDMNDLADDDAESMKGFAIMAEYFPSSETDMSSMPVLVLHFDDERGLADSILFVEELNEKAANDPGWSQKLDFSQGAAFMAMAPQMGEDGSGILMVGVLYNPAAEVNVINDTPELRSFIHGVEDSFSELTGADIGVYLTGSPALTSDTSTGSMEDISMIDPFTILLILILVGLFFRSFVSSAVPPMTIGFAFVVSMAAIFLVGQILSIFFFTQMMILVVMMGAGCDYCIFIIARYREELRAGRPHTEALHEAVKWAGESIATSGATVIIGFGAMAVCSYSMVSTMGICMALGILIALLAALTLIPSILAVVGDRVFWPSTMRSFEEGGKSTRGWYAWCGRVGRSYFERSSRFTLKHAKAIVLVAILVTVPAAYVVAESETSYDMMAAMYTGESAEGMDYVDEYANSGILTPSYVLMEYDQPFATVGYDVDPTTGAASPYLMWMPGYENMAADMESGLFSTFYGDGNVAEVSGVFQWEPAVQEALASGTVDSTRPIEIITYIEMNSPATISAYVVGAVKALGDMMLAADPGLTDHEINSYIVYQAAPMIDYVVNVQGGIIGGDYVKSADGSGTANYVKVSVATVESTMSNRSMETIQYVEERIDEYVADNSAVVATWVTGTGVVMLEVSEIISGEFVYIEILVVLLILVLLFFVMRSYTIPFRSVLTILMSICWTLALTHLVFVEILGGEIMWMVPLMLLVICLGLGMDYDILLTTRIKENVHEHGMSNDEAIHQAVVHSGSVITICGLIMGGAFGTMMLSSMELMQEFGFALCFAIFVDALVVRTYLVPAVMHLLGDWNWKGPAFMHRGDE